MVRRKARRGLLRLRINGLFVTNKQGKQRRALHRSGLQSRKAANDNVAGQLNNSAAQGNASIEGRRSSDDAVQANHGGLNHFPGRKRYNQRDHRAARKEDVLYFLIRFKKNGVLLVWDDLEKGL